MIEQQNHIYQQNSRTATQCTQCILLHTEIARSDLQKKSEKFVFFLFLKTEKNRSCVREFYKYSFLFRGEFFSVVFVLNIEKSAR